MAQAQFDKAAAILDLDQATRDLLRCPMREFSFTIPVRLDDGTVVAVVTEEGQTVNSAFSAPVLIKLAQLDTMTVKAQISEADVPRVHVGLPVYFTLLGDPDTKYNATLKRVEPGPTTLATDTGTTTAASTASAGTAKAIYYNGIFDVANPEGKLRIAMTAQATIVVASIKDVIQIPSAALGAKEKDGRFKVRVKTATGFDDRLVTIGLNNRVLAEVKDGLAVGDEVVTSEAPPAEPAKKS